MLKIKISFHFCKTCICLKILENTQISISMIDRLDITENTQWNMILSWKQLFLLMQR